MENLKNYGVVSLDTKETHEIGGGNFWAGMLVAYLIDVCSNTEEHLAAFKSGFEEGNN